MYSDALKTAIQVLVGGKSQAVVGAVLCQSQPALEHLMKENVIEETKVIISANVNPTVCLKSAVCDELSRLPLDLPKSLYEDRDLLDGLSLCFHFNRNLPLVTYNVKSNNSSTTETENCSDKIESNVILQIKPSFSTDHPSVLVTGITSITQIAKIESINNEILSVFVVPHQESKECLSLLPENTRKQLSNPTSLENAALHLALYHMRESLNPGLGRLTGKMKEKGKDFRKHYSDRHCKPEADLAAMLQGPDAKICPFIQSEYVDAQLKLYNDLRQNVFSDIAEAVSEEEGKQQRRITFLRDSLAWAYFYRHIRAEVYVMSAEDLKQEARLEVLNGIIIANIWRQTRCSIVITDSLQCPLSEVIQRDVRKLAFPSGSSDPIVRVGFLNKNFRRNLPFFTINPWSQAQSHVSHTISIDTSKHLVSCLGDEPLMHLIRDELDLKEGISTGHSNKIIGHIDYSPRPSISKQINESKPLDKYLKSIGYIGYKVNEVYGLKDVLDCLIGPSLVQQLRYINIPGMMGIIPSLLQQKTSGNSEFALTPTEFSASKAKVYVYISQKQPLQVGDRKVGSATFIVKKAKTMSVEIILKVSINAKLFSHKVSEHLDLKGSCGKTVADYIYGICCKDEAWLHTKNLTVGEVLHVFLREEKALMVIQSLPLFLSFPLSKCKIKHYLTTVLVDSSKTLKEGHIHASPFELSTVFVNNHKLLIQVESLALHIFPLSDIDQHMVQIEGNCTVNKIIPMKFTCTSTSASQKHAHFFFANPLPATEVFELLGIGTPPTSLTNPITGSNLDTKVSYDAGFVLSQLIGDTEEVSLTSLFFNAEMCGDIEGLLPPTLRHIQQAKVKAIIHFPSAATPMLGLEVAFTSKLEVPGSAEVESVMLECCLCVRPSIVDHSYTNEVTVRLYSNQSEQQKYEGMSIYSIISALSGTLGKNVAEQVGSIPTFGDQILRNISLRKLVLQLVNTEIRVFELHATMAELHIFPGKLSVNDCVLKISYSKDDLMLECSGSLVFLKHHKYSVRFNLPTADKKGELSFRSYKDLILKDLMQEFGWLSCDVKSNAVLAEVLDIAVRKVALDFHFTPKERKLQITVSDISIFKETLDVGIVKFHGIELNLLTKLVNGHYVTAFSLNAYISDGLYAELKYSPDSCILTGIVKVTYSKLVSAVDVLQVFKSPTSSYGNMKCILQEEFMDVFKSDLKISIQPGMTAFLNVSIRLPSEYSKHCSLEHLKLEVEDALKIVCNKDSYVLNTFQFEYLNKPQSEDITSTSHLSLVVHKLNAKESMALEFDFTSQKNNTNVFKAMVKAGPEGGFLKLSSAIDLARTAVPELPDFDVGLPPIFDIELLSGSVTFNLTPSFQPSAFDINILISEWKVFGDPKLTVHNLTLKTTWESGSYPQLSFTDCSLTFFNHQLNLSGRLNSEEVYIECSSAKKLGKTQFESILKDCTPSSQPQPALPTNIGLPSMEVELKELIIHLKKTMSKCRVNTRCVCHSPWKIMFGSHIIPVHELGGALEWEKLEEKTLYKAFLYGTIGLFGRQVDMELLLGKNIDSIISASITHPQCLHYCQVTDHLLCSEPITPYEKYNPSTSGLSELVPSGMQGISLTSASTALNVTKKIFFLSSEVQGWGTGSTLIGYLVNKGEIDYIVSLSLNKHQGFKFGRLSESIAFIDDYLQLQSMDILVSSTDDLKSLSSLTDKFRHSFSRSQVCDQPFCKSKILTLEKLVKFKIRSGTTVYAEINIAHSKGISKLLSLGNTELLERDISIMIYIGKSKAEKDLEVHAWLPQIVLFEMLKFTNIHLMYKVQKTSEFELTGTVALHLKMSENKPPLLRFDGQLSVNPTFAKFSTNSCREIVSKPCGIDIKVNDLKLALKMYLNGESPDVFVSGSLIIGYTHLTCKFLLKGISFKVFMIRLESGLMLSALFYCSEVDWPIELNIGIKEGHFYYANSDIGFEEDGKVVPYKDGYHLKAVITLFNSDFEITADIPSDRSDIVLSGRSQPIDFCFALITGSRPYTDKGPELRYSGKERSLALSLGVEILKVPCFEGELKYKLEDKSLEGTIRYPGRILWFNEPSMTVRWRKDDGFNIVDFSLFGEDVPGFSLLASIAKFAKSIYNFIKNIFSWSIKLHLKTGKNPDPRKHLVKLILYGEVVINVIGFSLPVFPLPELPFLLPRMDNFSFKKLPQYLLKCLWESAGPICRSLLDWINPWNLLKNTGHLIWSGIKGAVNTVVNVANKIKEVGKSIAKGAKKVWRGICSFFGRSAFILDLDNGMVLGYIRGGKGGRELCDEHYIVEQFGPILTVNAIGAMAHDVHNYYKSCLEAQEDEPVHDHDEVDGEEIDLDKGLDELKGKAEELSENLTIVADNILTVKEVSIRTDDSGENVLVDWFVYNPEENTYYNEDKGDIEYCVKVTATVIEGDNVKLISIYDDIFINWSKEKKEGRDKKFEDIATAIQTELIQDSKLENTDLEVSSNHDETSEMHTMRDGQDEMMLGMEGEAQNISKTESPSPTQAHDEKMEVLTEKEPSDENFIEIPVQVKLEEKRLGDKDADGEDKIMDEDIRDTNSNEDMEEDKDANKEDKDTESDEENNNMDEDAHNKQEEQPILKKHISLKVPLDPETSLVSTVCICASIQPRVTLEVKMLPPNEIATDKYKIDKQRLESGDTSWMDDTKKAIVENGRINEVTLEGKMVCQQQLIQPYTESMLQFTAQCNHHENSLIVYGDVMPVPEAHCYLVQLVDETDLTVVIKQSLLQPPILHYKMEAFFSDFPDTSSGPYHISIIALRADLTTCSAFTDSELKITRYCAPVGLTEILPNLYSSDSDTVRLEWRHPTPSKLDNKDGNTSEDTQGTVTTAASDSQGEDPPSEVVITSTHLEEQLNSSSDVVSGLCADEHITLSTSEQSAFSESQLIYTVIITGVNIKKPVYSTELEAVNSDNVDDILFEEAFKMSVPVHMKQDSQEVISYEFSLADILKKNAYEHQKGLLFQCQVVTNGLSKLQSMPKLFSEFILLAPPMDLKVTTPVRRAGLHIDWEYSVHAIDYRIEVVNEHTKEKAFSKKLKCETGSHGEAILYKNDFKDIPYTSSNSGYQLQMYSLGFGQELIRCLEPSVAERTFHVIPAELQYLGESKVVRVKFRPFTNVRAEYVVQLCRITRDVSDEPYHLTAKHIYDHEVCDETVRDFPLKKWWHLLQSGDLVIAWVRSVLTKHCSSTYIGAPQKEVCVMDSPKLETSPAYNSDGTMSAMKLAWSEVAKAQRYQYGYYLPDKKEYIAVAETEEREAVVDLSCCDHYKFQMYVTALGEPGAFVTGELTLATVILQSIKSPSLEHNAVIFTSISLQRVWWQYLTDHAFSNYFVPKVFNPQHFLFPRGKLFPSGRLFPSLNIPHKFMKRFWGREYALFGNGKCMIA